MTEADAPDWKERSHGTHPSKDRAEQFVRTVEGHMDDSPAVDRIRLKDVFAPRVLDDSAPQVRNALQFRRRVTPVLVIMAAALLGVILYLAPGSQAPDAKTTTTMNP